MISSDIKTPRLVLTTLDEVHVDDSYRQWMSDADVTRFLETRALTPSISSLRDYVTAMRESPNQYLFGMFERSYGAHVGNIKLGPVHPLHRRAAIGLIIGEKRAWGQGYASEAIAAISHWAFETLHLEKVSAGSYKSNGGSVKAFERNGFQIEGIQRSHVQLVDGSRDDVVVLGRTRSDWERSRQ